jgi:gliding motility-associated-like protein
VFGDDSKSFGTVTRWLWDFGDSTTASVPDPPPHLYAQAGEYEVRLVIEDNSGCISDTMKQEVIIGSYPIPDFTSAQLCTDRPFTITNQTKLDVGTIQQWEWDFGNGQTSNAQHPSVEYANTGSYTITLQATSTQGCGASTQKTVEIYPTPRISATGENVCIGLPISFTGTDLTPAIPLAQWYWDLDNGQQQTGQQINYIYPEGGAYQAGLHTVSTNGCFSDTFYVPVNITDIDLFAGNDTLIARSQPLQLNAQTTGSGLQFTWSPAIGLTDANSAGPIAYLQQDQVYYLTVTSSEGCIEKDTLYVKVYAGPEFYVPTAFSPNNDGRNDVFRAISPGVPQLDFFCVWNRWGQEVFRTQSLSAAWDGNFKGMPMPAGTYVWMIQGTDYTGRLFNRRGTVTIVR